MDYTAQYQSPLGGIMMASDGKALIGIWFEGQKYFGDVLATEHETSPDLPVFDEVRRWLDCYFSGKDPGFMPPVEFRGSDFRKRVWQELLAIPYGQITTYAAIALKIGCKSAQAVGGAVGHNPLSLIIPCHRVVGSNGSLTGYAGGIDRKLRLLQLEGAQK